MQLSRRRRAPPLRDGASSVASGSAYALKPDQKINLEYNRRREVRPRGSPTTSAMLRLQMVVPGVFVEPELSVCCRVAGSLAVLSLSLSLM